MPKTKVSQGVDSFQVLFQGGVIVDKGVHNCIMPGVFLSEGGVFCKHLELGQDQILVLVSVPGKMDLCNLDLIEEFNPFPAHHPDVKTQIEIHQGMGVPQLGEEIFPIRTGKDVWVTEDNLFLTIPKLRQIRHFPGTSALFPGYNAETASSWASPGEESKCGICSQMRIEGIIRINVFHLIWEFMVSLLVENLLAIHQVNAISCATPVDVGCIDAIVIVRSE